MNRGIWCLLGYLLACYCMSSCATRSEGCRHLHVKSRCSSTLKHEMDHECNQYSIYILFWSTSQSFTQTQPDTSPRTPTYSSGGAPQPHQPPRTPRRPQRRWEHRRLHRRHQRRLWLARTHRRRRVRKRGRRGGKVLGERQGQSMTLRCRRGHLWPGKVREVSKLRFGAWQLVFR